MSWVSLLVVEQLPAVHEDLAHDLIDPTEIGREVVQHISVLQPSYEILAEQTFRLRSVRSVL